MYSIVANNVNEVQLSLLKILSDEGKEVNVRNQNTLEIFPVNIEVSNPRERLTTIEERGWNLPFAIGEFSWHLSGSNKFDHIEYFSKNWSLVSEDKLTIRESCYGNRIFGSNSIWSRLIYELSEDSNSRRAVISLYEASSSLGLNIKDVACTSTIQYLVRDNQLECIVTMRSNDIIWGLPNDIFFFTMLQELLSKKLGIRLGKYYHNVGSLHIYERHFDLMNRIISNPTYYSFSMPEMVGVDLIPKFLEQESNLRNGLKFKRTLNPYWDSLLFALKLRSLNFSNVEKKDIIDKSIYRNILRNCPKIIFLGS